MGSFTLTALSATLIFAKFVRSSITFNAQGCSRSRAPEIPLAKAKASPSELGFLSTLFPRIFLRLTPCRSLYRSSSTYFQLPELLTVLTTRLFLIQRLCLCLEIASPEDHLPQALVTDVLGAGPARSGKIDQTNIVPGSRPLRAGMMISSGSLRDKLTFHIHRRVHDPRAFQMAEQSRPIYVQRVESQTPQPQSITEGSRHVVIVD